MPKRKIKPREEKTAEEYFPVGSDSKQTTEKPIKDFHADYERVSELKEGEEKFEIPKRVTEKSYSKPERGSLEKVVKAKLKRKYVRRTTSSSKKKVSKKNVEYNVPKISLKKDGYELVITEKPQAASKIASALGNARKNNLNKIPYYEVDREGQKIVVACAVGHLLTLNQKVPGSGVPIFDIGWVPNYLVRKKDFTKRYYDLILRLAKGAGSVTVATDFDVEGEVIGMNVVRYICGQNDANRMKFSTLTSAELNNAYENKFKNIFWGQAIAGETRHYLDWFYGINLSRALMNAIKSVDRFRIISIGRVQGPALNLIVKKEREIQAFKSKTYWQVFITENKNNLELKYVKDIFDKKELENFENLVGKEGDASTEKKEQKFPSGVPFNLTGLQTESYKFYGITPSNALRIAQGLYLAGLISYPRTSSQKLPESVNYNIIKKKLAREYNVEHLMKREKPIEGKKTDSAHPSIYPTGEKQILSGEESKIYDLIVKRFLALFCEDAVVENKKIKVIVDEKDFVKRGSAVRKKAWMEFYPSKLKEEEIPDLNGKVRVVDSRIEEKETQPPKRYSPASIVSELEKRNLGTKATRSSILETLYDRGYIQDKSIQATSLGMSLISTLEKYSPIIIDEKLTRSFEQEMEIIEKAKKDFEEKKLRIIEKAKKTVIDIAVDFEKNEKRIGKELVGAQDELIEKQKEENKLNECPVCKKGKLRISYSPKTRRHFVSCDAYPNCTNTYPLPPNGLIKKTDKVCEECGFPMLMRLSKGKRPWTFCFNLKCPTNEEWVNKLKRNG